MTAPPSYGKGLRVDLLAQDVLSAVAGHFATAAVALPERQYVAPGLPADVPWDCEQLTVSIEGIGWGVAEESYAQTMQANNVIALAQRHVVYRVELVRQMPVTDMTNNLPDFNDLNTFGVSFMRDMGLLSQATVTFLRMLTSNAPGCVARPGIVDPVGPTGGFVGASCALYISSMDLS